MLVVKTSGAMDPGVFIAMAEELLHHPSRQGCTGVLFDHTCLDFSNAGIEVLERVRAFHRSHEAEIGPGKSAMLMRPGSAAEWEKLWAQGEKIRSANVVRIFEDRRDAMDWITR